MHHNPFQVVLLYGVYMQCSILIRLVCHMQQQDEEDANAQVMLLTPTTTMMMADPFQPGKYHACLQHYLVATV